MREAAWKERMARLVRLERLSETRLLTAAECAEVATLRRTLLPGIYR